MSTPYQPSLGVRRTLRKLGTEIRDARIRRLLPATVVAERAFITRPTLRRIEDGDPKVSMGLYAAVLQALSLLDGLGRVAEPSADEVGLAMARENAPKRIRIRQPRAPRAT